MSHSKGHICFVTAKLAVGVDIEKITTKHNLEQLAGVFMSAEELHYLATLNVSHKLRYFYQIWCAKEAYFKAMPPVHQQHIVFNEISIHTELSRRNAWRLIDKSDHECYLSIVINNKGRKIQLSNHTLFD